MSHLVSIYAPDGEPFEVPDHAVGDLVLNKGWSQQKSTTVDIEPTPAPMIYDEAPMPEPKRGRGKSADVEPVAADEEEDAEQDA